MENQHRKITGYRELSQKEINLMNDIKEQGNNMGLALDATSKISGVDQRWISIARTHMQQGLMAWVRAITRPDSF